jgi:putative flippase GtrA
MCYNGPVAISALAARPGLAQFVKFCIVGSTSFAIDSGIYIVLLRVGFSPALALTISFLVAVVNGFYWNRRWTYRATDGDARKQGPKFLATNAIGLMLNLSVSTLALVLAAHWGLTRTHHTPAETLQLVLFRRANGEQGFSFLALIAAKICATVVVTTWNFCAATFFTFKK